MPIYEYGCSNCESLFEKMLRMAAMEEPLSNPCPECGSEGTVVQMATAANFGDSTRLGINRPDAGWGDVLSKVKQAHPRGYWDNKKFTPRSGR
jgi:putative FmdB family regulatory protein